MDKLQQRIAIAESTGLWTDIKMENGSNVIGHPFDPEVKEVIGPQGIYNSARSNVRSTIPDYLDNLSHIRLIVEGLPAALLDPYQDENFWKILGEVTGAENAEFLDKAFQRICSAEADKWCEAYLRVKKLWK